MREYLASNATLSYVAEAYRLRDSALIGRGTEKQSPVTLQNAAADLMEAYIGGSYIDCLARDQVEVWDRWMFDLISPEVFPELEETGWAKNAGLRVRPSRCARDSRDKVPQEFPLPEIILFPSPATRSDPAAP